MRNLRDQGVFAVNCDPALYGAGQLMLQYTIWQPEDAPKDLLEELPLIRERYPKAYSQLLAGVLSAYQNAPLWDVWIEEKKAFEKLDFARKEDLHPYLGTPLIDLAPHDGRVLWGMTFCGGENKLSIEHGFCAVFEGETLLTLADSDFPALLDFWDYYAADGNILTLLCGRRENPEPGRKNSL